MEFLQYIRSLLPGINGISRKRRAEDNDLPTNSKLRRVSDHQSPMEYDYMSPPFNSSNSSRHNRLPSSRRQISRTVPWSKEICSTLNVDDDDDVIEIPKKLSDSLDRKRKCSGRMLTSTPNMPGKFTSDQNCAEDDVIFVKSSKSLGEKQKNFNRQGFDYVKPLSLMSTQNENIRNNGNIATRPSWIPKRESLLSSYLNDHKTPTSPNLQIKKENALAFNQSFRLDDKLNYQKLLSDQSTSKSTVIPNKLLEYANPIGRIFSYSSTTRGKKLVGMCCDKKKPILETIDLTLTSKNDDGKRMEKRSARDVIKGVLNTGSFDIISKDGDAEMETLSNPLSPKVDYRTGFTNKSKTTNSSVDLEVSLRSPSPEADFKVERVNSLKTTVLDRSDPMHEDWINNVKKKYNERQETNKMSLELFKAETLRASDILAQMCINRIRQKVNACLKIKDEYILSLEDKTEKEFPDLTPEQEELIDQALKKQRSEDEVLSSKFNMNITRQDIITLAGLNWLNDEVINFYMNLIIERGKSDKWPNVYAFNTFFYPKIRSGGQSSVRRWTKKVDIFSYDMIFVPIHLQMHWCMAVIDFRVKNICYYDSMGSANKTCLESLYKYLQDEHVDKKKKSLDVSGWKLINVKDIPQQMNGSDCGMFSCAFAEVLSRDAEITFSQENMPYLRRKMVLEILEARLLIS